MSLKKVQVNNPLLLFGMHKRAEQYEKIDTDKELIDFYHKLLDEVENSTFRSIIYAMISYSTGQSINFYMFFL